MSNIHTPYWHRRRTMNRKCSIKDKLTAVGKIFLLSFYRCIFLKPSQFVFPTYQTKRCEFFYFLKLFSKHMRKSNESFVTIKVNGKHRYYTYKSLWYIFNRNMRLHAVCYLTLHCVISFMKVAECKYFLIPVVHVSKGVIST